ncbi:hypothetical protein COL922a_011556 [Colletotrichum nupharicola]|nr:hypothetical protein COL922a_011556 [Colletotrichum nupharicola]
MNAVMAIAEDEEGTAVLLQLYNQPEDVKADELLPQNSVHIIKEPFFKVTTNSKYSLRVDHVSDLFRCAIIRQDRRAGTSLRLGRPEKALADALRALGARHGDEPTEKGLFREAKALYGMHQFSLCLGKLQQVVGLNRNNKDAKTETERATCRIREQHTGEYMWKQMQKQARTTPPLIDCATFSAPVEAGDLLLCEKAFAYSYATEDDAVGRQNVKILMNLGTMKMAVGGQANLITKIVQKLYHNPQMASGFVELHRGNYRVAEPVPAEEPSVDTNCRRYFIGDMMIVRATKDIDADAELLIRYQQPKPGDDYQATQKSLENWSFNCQCRLCEDKKSTPAQTWQRRRALLRNLGQIMEACETPAQESEAERLLEQLDQYYPEREGALRLELWESYLALGQKRLDRGKAVDAFELTVKGLEALGFVFVASPFRRVPGRLKFEIKEWGQINDDVFFAFLTLLHAARVITPQLCEVVKGHARIIYAVCAGEQETAVDLYEELR